MGGGTGNGMQIQRRSCGPKFFSIAALCVTRSDQLRHELNPFQGPLKAQRPRPTTPRPRPRTAMRPAVAPGPAPRYLYFRSLNKTIYETRERQMIYETRERQMLNTQRVQERVPQHFSTLGFCVFFLLIWILEGDTPLPRPAARCTSDIQCANSLFIKAP